MNAYSIPAHPGQYLVDLQLDVAVAVEDEAVLDDVGVVVADPKHLQALEILAGKFEQADTNPGRLVVHDAGVAV